MIEIGMVLYAFTRMFMTSTQSALLSLTLAPPAFLLVMA